MTVLTYSEVLTNLCDWFDSYISPKSIKRTNSNIIYLILKAFAKGWEVINNTCIVLGYKFNPKLCSDDDLQSIALIAGTEFIEGKGSSLIVTVTNSSSSEAKTLSAGTYTYTYSSDCVFVCTLNTDISIAASGYVTEVFVMTEKAACVVTAQSSIPVTAVDTSGAAMTPDSSLVFSCADNSAYQGYADETNAEFRARILADTDRASIYEELQTKIRNLPTILDARLTYNGTSSPVAVGSYMLPAYNLLIAIRGTATEEMAELVTSYGIFPTYAPSGCGTVYYASSVFAGGQYAVNYVSMGYTDYSVNIEYTYKASVVAESTIKSAVASALASYMNPSKWTEYITEKTFYDAVAALSITGLTVLNVTLYNSAGTETSYIQTDRASIARLASVTYSGTAV